MAERPDPPAWGALITAALGRSGLSARAAARQAGLSEGRWRQITAGYQVVSPGVYAPVHGPAATVARMAAVAGLTAAQLRAVGRDDAARLLAAQSLAGQAAPVADDLAARIRAMDADQAREVLAQIASLLAPARAG